VKGIARITKPSASNAQLGIPNVDPQIQGICEQMSNPLGGPVNVIYGWIIIVLIDVTFELRLLHVSRQV